MPLRVAYSEENIVVPVLPVVVVEHFDEVEDTGPGVVATRVYPAPDVIARSGSWKEFSTTASS